MKHIFLILILLFAFCTGLPAQDGRLFDYKQYAHRSHPENRWPYIEISDSIAAMDSTQAVQELERMRKAGVSFGDKQMELEAEFISAYLNKADLGTEQRIEAFKKVYEAGRKNGIVQIQLRTLYWIGKLYESGLNNSAMALEYYAKMKPLLSSATAEEIPDKAFLCYQLGESYYLYKDYARAIPYFRMAIENPNEGDTRNSIHNSARNTIGLCYLAENEPDSAARWFRSILSSPECVPVWEAIAKGNLGKVYHRQGNYAEAAELLEYGMEKVIELEQDYGFAAGCCITLADIYVRRKNLERGKYYIDLAREYMRKSGQPERLRELYPVESRYYAYAGQPEKAAALLDSVLSSQAAYSREFNNLVLLRVEQKEFIAGQQAAEERLAVEKLEKENYRRSLLFAALLLVALSVFSAAVYRLYRKKRAAHRALVERIRQWAQVVYDHAPLALPGPAAEPEIIDARCETVSPEQSDAGNATAAPNDADRALFEQLRHLLNQEQYYRTPDVSLDATAGKLGVSRHYLSQAVNRCAGKNFNALINEHRVKEAVRIMSQENAEKLTIDAVAFDAGFNDRKSFYRVFKKVTGLSPSEFRANLGKE